MLKTNFHHLERHIQKYTSRYIIVWLTQMSNWRCNFKCTLTNLSVNDTYRSFKSVFLKRLAVDRRLVFREIGRPSSLFLDMIYLIQDGWNLAIRCLMLIFVFYGLVVKIKGTSFFSENVPRGNFNIQKGNSSRKTLRSPDLYYTVHCTLHTIVTQAKQKRFSKSQIHKVYSRLFAKGPQLRLKSRVWEGYTLYGFGDVTIDFQSFCFKPPPLSQTHLFFTRISATTLADL